MLEGYLYNVSETAVVTLSSGSNALTIRPVRPIEIIRWGVICTTALTSTELVLTGTHLQLGGAGLTPAGTGDLGTVTCTVANGTLGGGVYTEVVNVNAEFLEAGGEDIAGTQTAVTTKPFLMLPGEEATFTSDNGPDAGAGIIWAQWRALGFQANTTKRARPALTAPVADANWLTAYEEVTS